MSFYEISSHGWRVSTLGFGVCVGAFMMRLLADMLAWPWLVAVVVFVRSVGLGIAAWGLVVGWLDAPLTPRVRAPRIQDACIVPFGRPVRSRPIHESQ